MAFIGMLRTSYGRLHANHSVHHYAHGYTHRYAYGNGYGYGYDPGAAAVAGVIGGLLGAGVAGAYDCGGYGYGYGSCDDYGSTGRMMAATAMVTARV